MLTRARKKAKTIAFQESERQQSLSVEKLVEKLPSVLLSIVFGYAKPGMTRSDRQYERVQLCCATEDGNLIYTVSERPMGHAVQCVETTHFEMVGEYSTEDELRGAAIFGEYLYVVYRTYFNDQGITRLSKGCKRSKHWYIDTTPARATRQADDIEPATAPKDDCATFEETKEPCAPGHEDDRAHAASALREEEKEEAFVAEGEDTDGYSTDEMDDDDMNDLLDIIPYKRKNVFIAVRCRGQLQHIDLMSQDNCIVELKSSRFNGKFWTHSLTLNETTDEIFMVTSDMATFSRTSDVVRVVDANSFVQKRIISCGTGFWCVSGITCSRLTNSIYVMIFYATPNGSVDAKRGEKEGYSEIMRIVNPHQPHERIPLEFSFQGCDDLLALDCPALPLLLVFDSTALTYVRIPL